MTKELYKKNKNHTASKIKIKIKSKNRIGNATFEETMTPKKKQPLKIPYGLFNLSPTQPNHILNLIPKSPQPKSHLQRLRLTGPSIFSTFTSQIPLLNFANGVGLCWGFGVIIEEVVTDILYILYILPVYIRTPSVSTI